MTRRRIALGLISGVLSIGCGGSDDDGGATGTAGGAGTVSDVWIGYCTVTFTEDTPLSDVFGDTVLTARTGQEFLVSDFEPFGEPSTEIHYLTANGPDQLEIDPDASGAFPYTSNCDPDTAVGYYAAFTDVTVYAEETLATSICELSEGEVVPSQGMQGFAAAGDIGSLSGPQTYQLFLGGFSEQCGGAESGYISVPETQVLGTHTWLLPVHGILAPE